MIVDSIEVGMLQVNCYVLGCEETREAVIIDPGDDAPLILDLVQRLDLRPVKIINTHAHFDHLLGVRAVQVATGVPFCLHAGDRPVLERMRAAVSAWLGYDPGEPPVVDEWLVAGELVRFGQQTLEMRWTPGHSPGSITFVDHAGRRAFVGDALFRGSIGRTDLPGGNLRQLLDSIRTQIFTLPDDTRVYPGHGPATTVGFEKRTNPFFEDEADMDY
jgi:glyoxylase-like metal-dependent hydrolase (beta-lactamase superfamily II)